MLKKFEIGVYNKDVRHCVSVGERHRKYDQSWEDIHYVEILARDHADARRTAEKKFPPADGFVIDLVQEMKEFG